MASETTPTTTDALIVPTNTELEANSTNGTMKTCNICNGEAETLKVTPITCFRFHGEAERACNECWEAQLSLQVEELDPRDIECMFCSSIINSREVKRLAFGNTFKRYKWKQWKLEERTCYKCQARCAKSKGINNGLQAYKRERDGRIFTCQFCGFDTCTDCDRPEHVGETCQDYRTRVINDPKHRKDEEKTRAAWQRCPDCDNIIAPEGCGFVRCRACSYRFCHKCLISWVGKDCGYLMGKEAHREWCQYRVCDTLRRYESKRRFEEDEETKKRLQEKKQKRDWWLQDTTSWGDEAREVIELWPGQG